MSFFSTGYYGTQGGTGAVDSVNGQTGVVTINKGNIGLGNVDNTSDANKPISTATQNALDTKVDKVVGKQLSTEDFTTAYRNKLDNLTDNFKGLFANATARDAAVTAPVIGFYVIQEDTDTIWYYDGAAWVNTGSTVTGDMFKSTYDPSSKNADVYNTDNHSDGTTNGVYALAERTKLAGIQAGATANQTDVYLLNRVNHTGVQSITTIDQATIGALSTHTPIATDELIIRDTTLSTIRKVPISGLGIPSNASQIANTPAGNIAATNVQNAINELDSEKVSVSSLTASIVPNTPAGNIAATDVQAALNELDSEKIANSVLTTQGDLLTRDATQPTRLGIGTNGQVLTVSAGVPSWQTPGGVPSGSMLPFAGSASPTGWLLCDGQAVSRTTYATLFATIGTTWGAGDGSTTFNLPDMRAAAPVGAGTSDKYATNETKTLGAYENDQVETHGHTLNNWTGGQYAGNSNNMGADWLQYVPGNATVSSAGSSVGVQNSGRSGTTTRGKQVVVNYIIKF